MEKDEQQLGIFHSRAKSGSVAPIVVCSADTFGSRMNAAKNLAQSAKVSHSRQGDFEEDAFDEFREATSIPAATLVEGRKEGACIIMKKKS